MVEILRQKNQATYIVFPIVNKNGNLISGAAGLDSEIDEWSDGSAPTGFADCTNEATEIGTSGIYYLLLTASEMNYDYIIVKVSSTTPNALTQIFIFRTMVGDPVNLATSEAGRQIDVEAGGTVGVDFSNINGTLDPAEIADNLITAAKIATDAIGSDELATTGVNEIRDAILSDSTPFAGAKINQLSFDAGNRINANLEAILDTAISETSGGRIANNWDFFWDNADAQTTQTVDDVGGGAVIPAIINVLASIPPNIDLADTKTVRLALYLTDAIDDLPTTGEITVGTITIERSADGGTSWSVIRNAVACSEHAGCVYYDEVFSSGNGYASDDMIRITFKGQKVTIAANDFEIADGTDGMMFHTRIDAGVGAGVADWTSGEKENIRYALGITGTKTATSGGVTDAILTDTNEMQGKLPTNNIMGSSDKSDKDDDIDAILVDTNEIQGKLPTNNIMGSSVKTDKDDEIDSILTEVNKIQTIDDNVDLILADTNEMQGKLPTNNIMGSSVKSDKDDEIDGIKSQTDQLNFTGTYVDAQVRGKDSTLPLSTQEKADVNAEVDTALADINLDHLVQTTGAVSDATPSATDFDTNLTETTDNHYNGQLIVFIEGTLVGQARYISDYDGTSKNITVDPAFTEAPANNDDFIIVDIAREPTIAAATDWSAAERENIRYALGVTGTKTATSGGVTDAILVDTNEIQGKLPTNNIMGSSDKSDKDDDIDAILVDTNEIQTKLPTNNIMGSSVKTDKDDEIDAIKGQTDLLNFTTGNVHAHVKAEDDIDFGATKKASINTEVDNALNTAIPITPTADSINDILKDLDAKFPTNNIMGSSVKTDKDDEIDSILTEVNKIQTIDDNVDLILADTNEMQGKLPTNNIMGSSVKSDKDDEIDAILTDTNEIQGKLPTNYIMGSGVQSDKDDEIDQIITDIAALNNLSSADVQTVLENNDLDHLIQITAGAEKPTIGSYLDKIMNKDGSQTFSQATDSLEALRDNQGAGVADWSVAEREQIRDALGIDGDKTTATAGQLQGVLALVA